MSNQRPGLDETETSGQKVRNLNSETKTESRGPKVRYLKSETKTETSSPKIRYLKSETEARKIHLCLRCSVGLVICYTCGGGVAVRLSKFKIPMSAT